ncbi:hypothetical protein ElyMa_006638900 [Elysia marginata]|uniref:Uncharacterized protein n=1 Tax=Elysia marginata TaxID=1093978 RepID=A0AAV4IMU6_9GAST|nr:hypothetical protein ElyMa_006638900 [Elysia marginata]
MTFFWHTATSNLRSPAMTLVPEPEAVSRSVSFILLPDGLGDANIHPLFQDSQRRPATSWSRGFPPASGQHFRASRSAHR